MRAIEPSRSLADCEAVDVLLLCAVPVEWESLRELIPDAVSDPHLSDPAIRGHIEFRERSLRVALVEVGMGLTASGLATLKAIEKYRPSLVVFAGIAGGIKDVHIGGVHVHHQVWGILLVLITPTFRFLPILSGSTCA